MEKRIKDYVLETLGYYEDEYNVSENDVKEMLKEDITEQVKGYIYGSYMFGGDFDEFKVELEMGTDREVVFDDGFVSPLNDYFDENYRITYQDMVDNSGWNEKEWNNYLTNQVNSISSVVLDRLENNRELFVGWE